MVKTLTRALARTFKGFAAASVVLISSAWGVTPEQSYQMWKLRIQDLPSLKSIAADQYVAKLARAFLDDSGRVGRVQVFVADTLNASIWSQGNGHFVIHGGVLSQLDNSLEFNMLLALEFAHDLLGHSANDLPSDDIPVISPLLLSPRRAELWNVDGFASLVVGDPVAGKNFAYTLEQEMKALVPVAQFFQRMGWPIQKTAASLLASLQNMSKVPGASNLAKHHKNLGFALKLPLPPAAGGAPAFKDKLSSQAYAEMRRELEKSTQQKFPWLLGVLPYGEGKRLGASASPNSKQWVIAQNHIDHGRFEQAYHAAAKGAADTSLSEPFQFQKAQAILFLEDPEESLKRCREELKQNWLQFDYMRKLLRLQCFLVHGELTEALQSADAYSYEHPMEIEGAFWRVLIRVRLKMPVASLVGEIEKRWGGRPYVNAIKLLEAGMRKDKAAIQSLLNEQGGELGEELYSDTEVGALDFVRGWVLREVKESGASAFFNRANRQWPLMGLADKVLPATL